MTTGIIRMATKADLGEMLRLGTEFGHLMTYQQTSEGLEPHLDHILVREDPASGGLGGYYHCQPIRGSIDRDFIQETKVIPDFLMDAAYTRSGRYSQGGGPILGVCMQGAAHRSDFQDFIKFLQVCYSELWCWTSIRSVGRTDTYGQLGFSFNPMVQYTFPNPHKGGEQSTYQLGRWVR